MVRFNIVPYIVATQVLDLCNCNADFLCLFCFFFLMIRRPPRSTQSRSSAASDVYKRQGITLRADGSLTQCGCRDVDHDREMTFGNIKDTPLSLIHISEPTRPY